MNDFRKLEVWQKSKLFALEIYKICNEFPSFENFALASQMRRCSVSIPSNIAEGSSRKSNLDFSRFVLIALGSAYELETQLEIAYELKYFDEEKHEELKGELTKIQKMLYNLSTHLNKK